MKNVYSLSCILCTIVLYVVESMKWKIRKLKLTIPLQKKKSKETTDKVIFNFYKIYSLNKFLIALLFSILVNHSEAFRTDGSNIHPKIP